VKHQAGEARPSDGTLDIGAYEFAGSGGSRCDVNGDAGVNVADVQTVVNIILGVTAGTPGQGDLNRDGRVDVVDLQTLVNVVLGVGGCPG
jgi:hypothetical protein